MKRIIVLFGVIAIALTAFSTLGATDVEKAVCRAYALTADTDSDDQEETVYITNTGSKYHRSGCRYLKKSKIPISKDDALSDGYAP